jgi:hypothetical protein
MASNDPTGHSGSSGPGEDADDALGRLERRLDAASEAAERLLANAAARAARTPPPSGWQRATPKAGDGGGGSGGGRDDGNGGGVFGSDADLLLGLLVSVRDRIPADLQQRLAEAVRELLLALRALIDWYLERTDRRASRPPEVQDIPIL